MTINNFRRAPMSSDRRYHARQRRRSNKNLILPFTFDLTAAEWEKINLATTPAVDRVSLPVGLTSAIRLHFDDGINDDLGRIISIGRIFEFSGFVTLISMDTGVAPFEFRATYEDSVTTLIEDVVSLASVGDVEPFKVRFTNSVSASGEIALRSNEAAKAATLEFHGLKLVEIWPAHGG